MSRNYKCVKYLIRPDYYIRIKEEKKLVLYTCLKKTKLDYLGSECVCDCCLTSTQQFAAISRREQVNFQWDDDDEVCFVLDQHAELDFYSASSLKRIFQCKIFLYFFVLQSIITK
jgi:hypothetical protein